MKRWGLRASFLSSDTKADAKQNACFNHLNPNDLYTMCVPSIGTPYYRRLFLLAKIQIPSGKPISREFNFFPESESLLLVLLEAGKS